MRCARRLFGLQACSVLVSLVTFSTLFHKANAFALKSFPNIQQYSTALYYTDPADRSTPKSESLEQARVFSSSSSSSSSPHVRWNSPTPSLPAWQMQTAVTTFLRPVDGAVVQLHAQLHFGEDAYYSFYNDPDFTAKHDAVCYELLVDEELLQDEQPQGRRVLRLPTVTTKGQSPIAASFSDQATAQQHGWTCQVNAMNYSQPKWIHADLTRQEFRQRLHNGPSSKAAASPLLGQQQQQQPLWLQASSSSLPIPSAVTEAATALLAGPPFTDRSAPRRLFTNLFLPGTALANVLRAALWMTVPSPELSILLLDWSSILFPQQQQQQRNNNSSQNNNNNNTRLGVSPVSLTILQLLLEGRLQAVRQLLFGQVILLGQATAAAAAAGPRNQDLLIQQRNERAIQVVLEMAAPADATSTAADDDNQKSNNDNNKSPNKTNVALLYGISHCPDLQRRLQAAGFVPIQQAWRTAWSVPVSVKEETSSSVWSSSALLAVPFLYLGIGGLDWISTWQSVWSESSSQDAILYLLRHVLLYVGLSKIVLDWREPEEK